MKRADLRLPLLCWILLLSTSLSSKVDHTAVTTFATSIWMYQPGPELGQTIVGVTAPVHLAATTLPFNPCTSISFPLSCGSQVSGGNFEQGNNFDASDYTGCQSTGNPYTGSDVLYRFDTPPGTGSVTFSLGFSLGAPLDLFVYDCSGTVGCIASSTNANSNFERVEIFNPSGTYFVIVDAPLGSDFASWTIFVNCSTVNNDICGSDPIDISCGAVINGNTDNSVNNIDHDVYLECPGGGFDSEQQDYDGNDDIYRFFVPNPGALDLTLTGLQDNLDMFVFQCQSGSAVCLSSNQNRNTGTGDEQFSLPNAFGEYWVVIDGVNANANGPYQLRVNCVNSEDPCMVNSTAIACDQTISSDNFEGSNRFNSDVYSGCTGNGGSYAAADLVYRFSTPIDATGVTFTLTGLSANLDLFVYDCASSGFCAAASTASGTSDEVITINNPAGDYYLIVDGRDANDLSSFDLSVDCELIVSDDPCLSPALDISCGQTWNQNNAGGGNNFNIDVYTDCTNSNSLYRGQDRQYRFQTPSSNDVVGLEISLTGLNANLDLFVYDCTNGCIASSTNNGRQSEFIEIPNPIGTYYFIIDSRSSSITSNYSFTVDCIYNDDPCTAIGANLLSCGDVRNNTTTGRADNFGADLYSDCTSTTAPYDAEDRLYIFSPEPEASSIEISLTELGANLDLFVYDCDLNECIASSTNSGTNDELLMLDGSADTYYLIVDGPTANDVSDYTISVNCTSSDDPCASTPIPLNCGELLTNESNIDSGNNFNAEVYADCNSNTEAYSGNDQLYSLTIPAGTAQVQISLSGHTANLDLFLYDCSDVGTCLEASTNAELEEESITLNDPAENYLLMVDGTNTDQVSTYTIETHCCPTDPLSLDWLSAMLNCEERTCGVEVYYCDYQGQRVIDVREDTDRCPNVVGQVFNCSGELLFTYGGPNNENGELAGLLNNCELLFACPDEPMDGCDDCVDCFYFAPHPIETQGFSFYNNYCEAFDVNGNPLMPSYQWSYTHTNTGAEAAVTYLLGTDKFSPNPELIFAEAGTYEACLDVFAFLGPGDEFPSLIYNCCQTFTVGNPPCFDPPIAHFSFLSGFESGLYLFDASTSQQADFYTWDIPAEAQPVIVPGGQAAFANIPVGACYDICLLVNNDCGQSSYCLEVCNADDCNSTPEPVPIALPVVDGSRLVFEGIPEGSNWSEYQWQIPSTATFVDGSSETSPSPIINFTEPGRYTVCLSFLNACHRVCRCWTIYILDLCAETEVLAAGIPLAASTIGATNQLSEADYDCYQGTASFDAPDRLFEIVKPSDEGDLTISLINDPFDGQPLDLDLFLLDSCRLVAECLASSLNPFGQPYLQHNFDAIHLPGYPAGTYYIAVDGYAASQTGAFRLTATVGDLACDPIPITCGTTLTGNNQGAANNVSAYSCQPSSRKGGYTGPELVYRYTATFEGLVNVKLSGFGNDVDLDLIILSDCDQNSTCLGTGLNPAGLAETVRLLVSPGVDYYIIVDGWDGSEGSFELEIEHPTCAPLNTCENLCTNNCCDENCNHLSYDYVGNSELGTNIYQFDNTSGRLVCKWEVDGYEVPNSTQLDELNYDLALGQHTICVYLEDPELDCVTQCCKTIFVEDLLDCGEASISYHYEFGQGFQFQLANSDQYQTISWERVDKNTPLGTGPISDYLMPSPDTCEVAIISASYFDPAANTWRLCQRRVFLCPPEECGASSINFTFEAGVFLFDFDLPYGAVPGSVTWLDQSNGLEFGQGQINSVVYPGEPDCTNKAICVRYFDQSTQSWQICCRRVNLCDPNDCVEISYTYLTDEDAYQFSIPQQEGITSISWKIESPVEADLGSGFNSNLLKVATPCPTYIISVRYFDLTTYSWKLCRTTFNICPPEPCCTDDPLSLSWLQPLLSCEQYTCGLEAFCCRFQGQAVIHLRDDPTLCPVGSGQVYDCNGEVLFTYNEASGEGLDLLAQLSNCELIYECPGPGVEICNDGIDNDGDGLIDCEDPDCFFFIYTTSTNADCGINNGTAGAYPNIYLDIPIPATITNMSYRWSTGANTQTITGLAPGTYTVTATAANGCERVDTVDVGENNNLALIVRADTSLICEGDSTRVRSIVNGGQAPYTYSWSDGLGSSSTATASPEVSTTYFLTVSDSNGCEVVDSVEIEVDPKPSIDTLPPQCASNLLTYQLDFSTESGNNVTVDRGDLNDLGTGNFRVINVPVGENVLITAVNPNTSCTNELLVISPECPCPFVGPPVSLGDQIICADDPIPPLGVQAFDGFLIRWYDAATGGQLLATGFSYTPATAGTYYAERIAVINDCVSETRTPIRLIINPLPDVSISGETEICAGDNSTLTATGALQYEWSTGENTASITVTESGTYSVIGTDENDCQSQASIIINVAEPLQASFERQDVSCNGFTDGSAQVLVMGGTPTYTFAWSNGSTDQQIENLAAGTYIVNITDANDCVLVDSIAISEPPPLTSTATSVNPDCSSLDNGAIELLVEGGTPPYRFQWADDPEQTTGNRTGLPAGSYTVRILDANDCEMSETYELAYQQTLELSFVTTDVSCNGGTDGEIALIVSGGTAPYNFLWSDQSTDSILTGIAANRTFSVIVTDAVGCTISGESSVQEPVALNLNTEINNALCFGAADGRIVALPSGGTPPYTYNWSDWSTAANLENVAAGTYSVIVTDDNDCVIESGDLVVTEPDSISVEGIVTNATSCASTPDGAIEVSVMGGTGPYTYEWSNGGNVEDLSDLTGGVYTLRVVDQNGCEASREFVVEEPPMIAVESTVVAVSCNGASDGSIDLIISGGQPPYDIQWSDNSTDESRIGLVAGTYEVMVEDADDCSLSLSITVSEPEALALVPTLTNISCFGLTDGNITMLVTGGTPPYSYAWSNNANTQNLSDLTAGSYTVTITDANDCTIESETFTISEPQELTLEGTVTDATSCGAMPDGAVDITVSGGTGPYTYSWSNSASTEDISAVGGGSYTIEVTDANNCVLSRAFTVGEPSAISVITSSTPVSCNGLSDGSLSLEISGGLEPYDINWEDGNSSPTRENLPAGNYSVVITDANSCTFNTQIQVEEPAALVATAVTSNISCFGEIDGVISLAISGGSPPYTTIWSNGVDTETIDNLGVGNYAATITDANNCELITETFTVIEPPILEVQSEGTQVTACGNGSDGAISLGVSGGTGEYTYTWSNGATSRDISNLIPGTYEVTVTDENNCEAVHSRTISQPSTMLVSPLIADISCVGATDGSITLNISGGVPPYSVQWEDQSDLANRLNLGAGMYAYTVTDAVNCLLSGSIDLDDPTPLLISATISPISCFGTADGSINIEASGGAGGYRYEWSNGSDSPVNDALAEGTYTLQLFDQNNCLLDTSFQLQAPPALTIASETVRDASCVGVSDGGVDISIVGGIPPYIYTWSNNTTAEDLVGVEAGTYTVTIQDAAACELMAEYNLINSTFITLNVNVQTTTCGEDNGQIDLDITGGTGPYLIDWDIDGLGDQDDEQNLSAVATGSYQVIVVDQLGCSASLEAVEVGAEQIPSINILEIIPSICGASTGAVMVEVVGGVEPFTYSWSNNSTTQNLSDVPEGEYILEVIDANDCVATSTVSLSCTDPCSAVVGSMGQDKLEGCQSEILQASYDGSNEVVGADEVRLFVIHNSSGNQLGSNILNLSTTPQIVYTAEMVPGQEYYLSAVIGKNDGNGLIDFNNSCLAVAPGTPFSFAPTPIGPVSLIATNSILCPGQSLELVVAIEIGGEPTYQWETPRGIITTDLPELIIENFGEDDVGEYRASYLLGGCESDKLGPLLAELSTGSSEVSAGEDLQLCGNSSTNLLGTLPSDANGTWVTTSSAHIADPNDPQTLVDSLPNGPSQFIWLVDIGSCLVQDTVEVYHAVAPTTQDRSITMEANQATLLLNKKALFDAITQSIPDSNLQFTILETPDFGDLTVDDANNQLVYQRDLEIEEDVEIEFVYELCNQDPLCGELCSESTISLTIQYLETEIISYKRGLRPGGNTPVWNITLLRDLDKADLSIVDRWGKLVHKREFRAEDNLAKGRILEGWDGTNLEGVPMFTGAYYFIFEGTPAGGDATIVLKGIVYLLK